MGNKAIKSALFYSDMKQTVFDKYKPLLSFFRSIEDAQIAALDLQTEGYMTFIKTKPHQGVILMVSLTPAFGIECHEIVCEETQMIDFCDILGNGGFVVSNAKIEDGKYMIMVFLINNNNDEMFYQQHKLYKCKDVCVCVCV